MCSILDLKCENDKYVGYKKIRKPLWLFEGAKKKVNILALGDVGSSVLLGLRLLGGDVISKIGIYDQNDKLSSRYEMEMNQIQYPWDYNCMPQVESISIEHLFDCDIFVFCATKGVPKVGCGIKDVRMAQFAANKDLIEAYAKMASECGFKGLFAVVSDPIEPLCKAALLKSDLNPDQIQGYGLGVMNARAAYYAQKYKKFSKFLNGGRVFGSHGEDLIVADSIENYNDTISKELTNLTVEANFKVRELGYKPYIAPAISSATFGILQTIKGQYHYSSNYLNGIYFGAKNRTTTRGVEWENLKLPKELFDRIEKSYKNIEGII